MKTSEIRIKPIFSNLFETKEDVLDRIVSDMKENGFDKFSPVHLWFGTVIDGHTRLKAAEICGILDVPVFEHKFSSEEEAIDYAVKNQRNRRNLTDVELYHYLSIVDKEKKAGRPKGSKNKEFREKMEPKTGSIKNEIDKEEKFREKMEPKTGSINSSMISTKKVIRNETKDEIAKKEKIPKHKIEKIRAIRKASEEVKESFLSGEVSLNETYKKIKKTPVPKKIDETKEFIFSSDIDWFTYSWNPIEIHNDEPEFYPERLDVPKLREPFNKYTESKYWHAESAKEAIVEVCPKWDMFGDNIPSKWIQLIIDVMKATPRWNYALITENYKRYANFEFPHNCWLGGRIRTADQASDVESIFPSLKGFTWVYFDSILEDFVMVR